MNGGKAQRPAKRPAKDLFGVGSAMGDADRDALAALCYLTMALLLRDQCNQVQRSATFQSEHRDIRTFQTYRL